MGSYYSYLALLIASKVTLALLSSSFLLSLPEVHGFSGSPALRVVGGVNATEGEFPFIVSLQMVPDFGNSYHYCAGSIFNSTHVIVTANCVIRRELEQVQVVAGAYNLTSSEESTTQRRSISNVLVHPEFDPESLRNDIALLTLNQSFEFNSNVQSMPLPTPNFNYSGNCTIIGWGSSLVPGFDNTYGQLLQKLNTTLVETDVCQSIYEFIHSDFDNSTMVCAKGERDDKTQGPCTGDSGAPLICESGNENEDDVVAAIMSWSMIPCGDSSYPSIYTNVTTLSTLVGNT